jgi:pyruvate formate lyase activating enzyme
MGVSSPLVSRIRRLSIDDGPGLRDVVFLKGCRLRCPWCHNPEAVESGPSILFFEQTCIGCGECEAACPNGAIRGTGADRIDRTRCKRCGACADICPARALEKVGEAHTPDALGELLLEDKPYFDNSGGGVTFSGGEPARHSAFLKTVILMLKRNQIHVALQTSGDFDLDDFEQTLLPLVDIIYFDLKLIDPERHRAVIGVSNDRILTNFEKLAARGAPLVPRTPLVPGITDTEENLTRIAAFLGKTGVNGWSRLPFNPAYPSKWAALGKTQPFS